MTPNSPEDVQGADLTSYFKILLSAQPEAGVRDFLKARPEFAERAVEYLEYRDVQKIFQEPDRSKRFQRLLPYYLGAAHESTRMSVRRAIIEGGPASGPYLMGAFHNLMHRGQRRDIIHIWAWTGYAGCADLLLDLLDRNYLRYVRLQARLEREKMDSKIDRSYVKQLADEVAVAIYALGEINVPSAAQAIEKTRTRWQNIETYRGTILENCDRAVQRIKKRTDRRSQSSPPTGHGRRAESPSSSCKRR
ncbi:MAG: hypothetical protein IH991_18925 [Planctomycetes bacterium]|nr:hypothetical protein [Planctomycetota bacterium]